MKLNNFLVVFYGMFVLGLSFYSYRTLEEVSERTEAMDGLITQMIEDNTETQLQLSEMRKYILFMEQAIPDIQKRNAKAKIVREIVQKEIKNTRQNYFKSEREFNDYVLSVVDFSDKYRVPTSLILAVSRTESNFNPRAVSRTNAQGVMQLMPDTTKYCVDMLKKTEHDAFYVRDSVQCGTWYLKQMLDIFKDESLVIQAYNVGPSYIIKFKGQDLPTETVNYHERVTGFIAEYRPKFTWEN
jgi:soluble lytic murein transglycosylase-like protein